MEAKRRSLIAIVLSSLLVLAFAGTAAAQPRQEGLVNVNVSDVTIQVPIAVAANICDVNVNVLARQIRTGEAECTAVADSEGVVEWHGKNRGPKQDGLVNVNISDVILQVPASVAANVCDVNVNVLAEQIRTGDAECDAAATADAWAPRGG